MSSDLLHRIDGQAPPSVEAIAPERLIEGAPSTRTSIDYERNLGSRRFRSAGASEDARSSENIYAGEWSAEIGAWRVSYEEWEFCHVLEGACELIPEGGASQHFNAGDSFVVEPGFKGVWRVLTPMRKRFVVRLIR